MEKGNFMAQSERKDFEIVTRIIGINYWISLWIFIIRALPENSKLPVARNPIQEQVHTAFAVFRYIIFFSPKMYINFLRKPRGAKWRAKKRAEIRVNVFFASRNSRFWSWKLQLPRSRRSFYLPLTRFHNSSTNAILMALEKITSPFFISWQNRVEKRAWLVVKGYIPPEFISSSRSFHQKSRWHFFFSSVSPTVRFNLSIFSFFKNSPFLNFFYILTSPS